MKYLRWIGLMSSLLTVGAFGELMAPLPSEAVPTLTLQVDSGPPVNILGAATVCSTTSFNQCYAINTILQATGGNPSRNYKASAAPGGLLPRLNVGDFSAQDVFKLTGVLFGPTSTTWATNEVHVVRIVMTNTFSAAPNNAGNYILALKSGGYVQAGPLPVTPNVTQYDFLKFEGKGTFSSTLVNVNLLNSANLAPLSLQIGNAVAKTYFTLNQVVTYPTFNCLATDGSGKCKPTITLTYTQTFYGPDSLVLTDSNDMISGPSCKLTPADGVDSPTGPVLPCHSNGKKKSASDSITDAIIASNTADVTASTADPDVVTERAEQCVVDCPCADPDTCKGTIVTKIRLTPTTGVLNLPFQFATVGDFGAAGIDPPVTIISDRKGLGSNTISDILTIGHGSWMIKEGVFPPIDANTSWDTDQIACVSALNRPATETTPAFIVTTWTVGGTSEKGPLTVDQLGGGDTLTCEWHIHKNSGN